MGCFLSTNKATPSPHSAKTRRPPPPPPSPPPLPPHPVEETVKEVLSETPKSKPVYQNTLKEDPKKMVDKESIFQEKREARHFKKSPKKTDNRDEVSEISEIYSILSESISASTERRENQEEQQRVLRSPEKFKRRSVSGDFTAIKVKSPATRPDPSPNRARIVPGRERRGVVKDAGESSRRRSRSPVIRNDGVRTTRQSLGRSSSLRKTAKSPSRVRSDLAEKSRRNMAPTSNELLENPLVSLECFIFL